MSDFVRPADFGCKSRASILAEAIRIPAADPSWPHSGAQVQLRSAPLGGWPKRAIDIVIALVALPLLSPLMLISMILIKLTMGGPVIFAHYRIGHNGQLFPCFKFRTMVSNADEVLERHLAENPEAEREWRNTMKLKSDPRVNMLGRVLRKSSIDEIPQLVNVLRGEMSCVGPRPIIADELPRYDTHLSEYLQARPGMTGVWQISGRNTLDYAQRVALDCEYIRNWSVWRDLVILGKTIFVLAKFHESS